MQSNQSIELKTLTLNLNCNWCSKSNFMTLN